MWRHEWTKHGTCAARIPALDSENKYFGQGLSWLQQYSMSSILKQADILPDSENSVITIQQGVTKVLKVQPVIHCVYDRLTDYNYLSEIRICFNKSLELIDCTGVIGDYAIEYPGGKVITNCDIGKQIRYPSVVPPTRFHDQSSTKDGIDITLVNIFKLIQLVKWFSL